MGSPWNNPSVPRRARARLGRRRTALAESQTPQGGPLQWPRCFSRCFSRRRGGPAVLGLGSLLTGGLLPGLDPLGVLQLQGLLGFGADGRGLELLSDLPLEPFGVDPRPGHGAGGKRRGERQVFPNARWRKA